MPSTHLHDALEVVLLGAAPEQRLCGALQHVPARGAVAGDEASAPGAPSARACGERCQTGAGVTAEPAVQGAPMC